MQITYIAFFCDITYSNYRYLAGKVCTVLVVFVVYTGL